MRADALPRGLWLLLLAGAALVAFGADLFLGSVSIPPERVLRLIASGDRHFG